MQVQVYYAGREWVIAEGTTRADIQTRIMRVGGGGGVIELDLADGGTLAIVVGLGTPIAIVEREDMGPFLA